MISKDDENEKEIYQEPVISELDDELSDCLTAFVVDDCGIDENVAAFIAMYSDFCGQRGYINWMKSIKSIIE